MLRLPSYSSLKNNPGNRHTHTHTNRNRLQYPRYAPTHSEVNYTCKQWWLANIWIWTIFFMQSILFHIVQLILRQYASKCVLQMLPQIRKVSLLQFVILTEVFVITAYQYDVTHSKLLQGQNQCNSIHIKPTSWIYKQIAFTPILLQ